ncbi:MAG: amidase [Gemmatimonadota bacterium]|jgi:amidase
MDSSKPPKASVARRDFVKLSGLGAAALATGSCAPGDAPQRPEEAEASGSDAWWTRVTFELEEVPISTLQDETASGRWSAQEITRLYLERIDQLDRQGPRLRSVIETNPDALEIAAALDDERARGEVRGPLHGVPILVKDNVDTADKMVTAAGSLALEGHHPQQDSGVAARLRDAGAIILGKANLSEWANFRSTSSSSGWSGRGGQCANAFALDRNPCGSSSGSGASVSANFCAAAIGTETNGSIVCPSSINGVVGIKPTVGLVSRAGIIPISHTQDTAGPMARTVADAAAVLGALTGVDPRDGATEASNGHAYGDYLQFLDREGLRGARIGVERSFFGSDARVDDLMEDAIRTMADAGATIVDPANLATRREIGRPSYQVLLYEFKADLDAYLQEHGAPNGMGSLADLIAFNEANADREMPFFGQEIFEAAQAKGDLSSPEYLEALETARRLSRDEGIDALMEEHSLDAIVAPTSKTAWVIDLLNRGGESGGASGPAAIAGYPSVTVPNGYVLGMPVGILFFGRAWSEPTLLKIAYAYEQASKHRRAARMVPTLNLRNAVM